MIMLSFGVISGNLKGTNGSRASSSPVYRWNTTMIRGAIVSPRHRSWFPTSNCQCAAWRSCFAWSAAQPAVRTNWLIITWCLSSSIFHQHRVLLAATGSRADFRPFGSLSSPYLYPLPPPQSSTITAGSSKHKYLPWERRSSTAWLTAGHSQSEQSIAGGTRALGGDGPVSPWPLPSPDAFFYKFLINMS